MTLGNGDRSRWPLFLIPVEYQKLSLQYRLLVVAYGIDWCFIAVERHTAQCTHIIATLWLVLWQWLFDWYTVNPSPHAIQYRLIESPKYREQSCVKCIGDGMVWILAAWFITSNYNFVSEIVNLASASFHSCAEIRIKKIDVIVI